MRKSAILSLLLFAIALWSCDDNVEDRPVVSIQELPVLDAPFGNTYILSPENPNALVETFTWDEAVYTEGVVPQYTLEIDFAGSNFADFRELGSTTDNRLSVTVGVLNSTVLALSAAPFSETLFEVRLRVDLGTMNPDYAEDIYIMAVTPYSEFPRLWAPGGYQSASGYTNDWSPADAPTLRAANLQDGISLFEGYVYFNAAGEFKFTDAPDWNNGIYGDNGAGGLEFPGNGAGNLSVAAAGYYKVTVDTENLTYSLQDASSWAITGSATPLGWPVGPEGTPGEDHDMTYDPDAKTWSITLDLTEGEFKFRANDAWALNYGTDGDSDGSLDENGLNNFTVESAGNYTVILDLSSPRHYTYSITQN